jgi:hypothetical protein
MTLSAREIEKANVQPSFSYNSCGCSISCNYEVTGSPIIAILKEHLQKTFDEEYTKYTRKA